MCACGFLFAQSRERNTQPVVNVTLIRQDMFCFAQIFRGFQRVFEMLTRDGRFIPREGIATQCEMSANMLAEGGAFATFPRLKFARRHNLQGLRRLSGLVVESAKFDTQIIAIGSELRVSFEFPQTFLRLFTQPFPKLVAFEQQSRVPWVRLES